MTDSFLAKKKKSSFLAVSLANLVKNSKKRVVSLSCRELVNLAFCSTYERHLATNKIKTTHVDLPQMPANLLAVSLLAS